MTTIWHWITLNWGRFGIGAILIALVPFALKVFKWKYPSASAWTGDMQEKEDRELDSRVLEALANRDTPRRSRGQTGSGMPLTRVLELAEYLKADRNAVEDSLTRLGMRRRVSSSYGEWFPLPD
jgi:hypothetical protein